MTNLARIEHTKKIEIEHPDLLRRNQPSLRQQSGAYQFHNTAQSYLNESGESNKGWRRLLAYNITFQPIWRKVFTFGPADAANWIDTNLPKIPLLTQSPVGVATLYQRFKIQG